MYFYMEKNARIAKNTIMLYLRMILNMVVSIYTGRVVLQVLGVDDFGIYNIVGGIVVMFSFINNFLNVACERSISISIVGKDKNEPNKIFRTSLFIHLVITLLFAFVAETVGLWFVHEKLVIPEFRFEAAICLYHIYVFNSCLTILRVPFNAAIIAEEKMDFYAYTSIVESVLRLLVIYLLIIVPLDKLISYALLHTFIVLFMLIWYYSYSKKHFYYCGVSIRYDTPCLKKLVTFSGWNLFGSIADLGYKQGTNIILNLFCGVALNAAMGLATTVRSTIFNFINNFQLASNPQIIKSYSLGDYDDYCTLLYRVSRFSYFLMLFLAVPAMINMDYVLTLWLKNFPAHTTPFVILGLVYCLIDCLHGPLWTSMMATGKIRNYQLVASSVLLLNVPLSYVALYLNYPPESLMIIQIAISVLTLAVRLIFSIKYAHLNFTLYWKDVIVPVVIVTIVSVPLPCYISSFFGQTCARLLISGAVSLICTGCSVFLLGMKPSERHRLNQFVKMKTRYYFKHHV